MNIVVDRMHTFNLVLVSSGLPFASLLIVDCLDSNPL